MLTLREVLRIGRDIVGYTVASRRLGTAIGVSLIALALAVTLAATAAAPLVLYPFI